jgi:hypothetical protein
MSIRWHAVSLIGHVNADQNQQEYRSFTFSRCSRIFCARHRLLPSHKHGNRPFGKSSGTSREFTVDIAAHGLSTPYWSKTKSIEAAHLAELSDQTSLSLLKLALYTENEDNDEDEQDSSIKRPSAFHLLLAAFSVLLHRYTDDTDLVIGSSSPSSRHPLFLRLSVDPTDPYWAVVHRVKQVEAEADSDIIPFETITRALNKNKDETLDGSNPLFRVRFFDETDELKDSFIRTTSLTSDLTVFITRPPASARASLAPRISLRILYNSLLFTSTRNIHYRATLCPPSQGFIEPASARGFDSSSDPETKHPAP